MKSLSTPAAVMAKWPLRETLDPAVLSQVPHLELQDLGGARQHALESTTPMPGSRQSFRRAT